MVDTHKLAEMEKLLEKVALFFKEIEWGVMTHSVSYGLTSCLACSRSVREDHTDSCLVKEVLSYE